MSKNDPCGQLACCRGWAIFNEDTSPEIQRDDECARFSCDEDAVSHVLACPGCWRALARERDGAAAAAADAPAGGWAVQHDPWVYALGLMSRVVPGYAITAEDVTHMGGRDSWAFAQMLLEMARIGLTLQTEGDGFRVLTVMAAFAAWDAGRATR